MYLVIPFLEHLLIDFKIRCNFAFAVILRDLFLLCFVLYVQFIDCPRPN